MLGEAFKAHSKLCANGCILLLTEESLFLLMQNMIPVFPHVPSHIPQLLNDCY
jgi:hypothetical protein